jgi:putative transposase
MRLPRRTYDGAFHHGMNRGYEGRPIFGAEPDKVFFLGLLKKVQTLTKIRILAYCVMDNHYHLVLQNISSKMSGEAWGTVLVFLTLFN